jgi:hypothetical protein
MSAKFKKKSVLTQRNAQEKSNTVLSVIYYKTPITDNTVFDFSWAFRCVNTDFFLNFADIFLISPMSDQSDFLLRRAVRTVCPP